MRLGRARSSDRLRAFLALAPSRGDRGEPALAAMAVLGLRDGAISALRATAWLLALTTGLAVLLLGVAGTLVPEQVAGATADVQTVVRANVASSLRLMIVGLVVVAYLLSYTSVRARRLVRGGQTWWVHWGWVAVALVWICLLAVDPWLDAPPDGRIWGMRLFAPLLLTLVCAIEASGLGVQLSAAFWGARVRAGVLGLGFVALALANVSTLDATERLVRETQLAFGRVVPPQQYWWTSSNAGLLGSVLDNTRWLFVAYAFWLAALSRADLAAFYAHCPGYPHALRRIGVWIGPRQQVLIPWSAFAAAVWLFAAPALTGGSTVGPAGESAARLVTVLPFWVLLLVPGLAYVRALASQTCDGLAMATAGRRELLERTRFSMWLVLLLGALVAGNLFMWLYTAQVGDVHARVVNLGTALLQQAPPEQQVGAAAFVGFVVVAFISIVVQYALLVELPFWWGQTHLKVDETCRADADVRTAESGLKLRLAEAEAPDAASEAVAEREYVLSLSRARWDLALDRVRRAREIPEHTVKSLPDAASKLLLKAGPGSLLLGLSGQKDAWSAVQHLVGSVAGWLILAGGNGPGRPA